VWRRGQTVGWRFVLNCSRNGFSIEQMQAITGLGEEELQKILRSTPV
jgi:hypothetical protein